MGAWCAFRHGIRRVNGAPVVIAGMVCVTLLVALPLSVALRGMLEAHLGRSLAAGAVASGTSYDWWQEFSAQASGLGATFVPSIIGFGAVLDNLSGLFDNLPLASTITGVTAAWMVVWTFLSGGILDRLARARPMRSQAFFAACGTYFWRLARLGLIAFAGYYVLFAYVVEDRRSATGAVLAAIRFVRRHQGGTIGLYLLNGAAFVALVVVYAAVMPGAPRSGIQAWLVLGTGQAYIVVRHYLKLVFYGSQTAYFQGMLAHAAYTAAPPLVWPESPAAEAIVNAGGAIPR